MFNQKNKETENKQTSAAQSKISPIQYYSLWLKIQAHNQQFLPGLKDELKNLAPTPIDDIDDESIGRTPKIG